MPKSRPAAKAKLAVAKTAANIKIGNKIFKYFLFIEKKFENLKIKRFYPAI
jgi:hypothetical protein